jgi:alkylhydroperoxidase family enzyme
MFLLRTVDPDAPTPAVAGSYQAGPGNGVSLMRRILSASPGLLERVAGVIGHYGHHRTLSPELVAAVNYTVAASRGHKACEVFNAGRLSQMGMSADNLARLASDPSAGALSAAEAALLSFVLRAVASPGEVSPEDIDRLRGLGLDDADILDATYLGANMLAATVIYKAFYRDEAAAA